MPRQHIRRSAPPRRGRRPGMSRASLPHLVIRALAGSGKTHRLTNRYLSLLASGVEPSAILATTFTRKAAGEILGRVLSRLATAAGDAKEAKILAEQIHAKDATPPGFTLFLRAM